MKFCANTYLNGVLTEKDVAPADPAIYKTPAYRVIAFCKNTAVLDMLRTEVGDERFFAGWRRVFEDRSITACTVPNVLDRLRTSIME